MKRLYLRDGSRTTLSLKTTISLLRQSQKHLPGCCVVVRSVGLGVVVLIVVPAVVVLTVGRVVLAVGRVVLAVGAVVLGVVVRGVVLRAIGVVRNVGAGVVF